MKNFLKNVLGALLLCFVVSPVHAVTPTATVSTAWTFVYASPRTQAEVLGRLNEGQELTIIGKTTDASWVQIAFQNPKDKKIRKGFVKAQDLTFVEAVEPAEVEPVTTSNRPLRHREVQNPWSFGAGLGGYAVEDERLIAISLEVRYLWREWTETYGGLDFTFGSRTAVGARLGERFYLIPDGSFRPYAQVGARWFDVTRGNSLAAEFGAGFQIYHHESSYFELGALYIVPASNSEYKRSWVFAGSSGIRF